MAGVSPVFLGGLGQKAVAKRNGFSYRGRERKSVNNTVWKIARTQAGLPQVRIHDVRHTFGRRLRAASVSFEDRQDLPGHKAGRITTQKWYYSSLLFSYTTDWRHRPCGGAVGPDLERSHDINMDRNWVGLILFLPTRTRVPTNDRTIYLKNPVPQIVNCNMPSSGPIVHPA